MYESFSVVFTLAALLSYINYKWLKLPSTIGQMILALVIALLVILLRPISPGTYDFFCDIVLDTDFTHILLDVMLGFLLFAGALHVDITALKKERWSVLLFATLGVLISSFLIGIGIWGLALLFKSNLPFIHCLLFGALISPTDPIAVLSLLSSANVSESLRLKIEGESLFNDGIGVIVFTAVLLFANMGDIVNSGEDGVIAEIFTLLLQEVFLGLFLGWILGVIGFRLMQSVTKDKHHLSTVISLAVVFGGYSLSSLLHTSGPLAMVVAGLYIGNSIKEKDFDPTSRQNLTGFWSILDESLNGVLFVLIGLAIHLVSFDTLSVIMVVSAVVLVILSRFIAVTLPYSLLKHTEHSWLNTAYVLTWGGLRGGISLALAFSLAPQFSRDEILLLTYSVVIFSILVQGLTIPKLIKSIYHHEQ
jgi:CPA1 family monovalent cation:H+ antiporter